MATKVWDGTDVGNVGKWGTAANWVPAGVPVSADDIVFEDSSQSVTADFNQAAVIPASMKIEQSFTGEIGDADDYLQIGMPTNGVRIGEHYGHGTPNGSARLKLDLGGGSATAEVYVHDSASTSSDPARAPIQLKLPAVGVDVHVRKGKVEVAGAAGETSTMGTLKQTFVASKESDSEVVIGSGVTITKVEKSGGRLTLQAACATVENMGGTLQTEGSGAITTLTAEGGRVIPNSTGTIGTLEAYGAEIDGVQSAEARTITEVKYKDAGSIKIDPDVVTVTTWSPQEPVKMTFSPV